MRSPVVLGGGAATVTGLVLGKNEGRMEVTSNKAWGTGKGTPTLGGCSARAQDYTGTWVVLGPLALAPGAGSRYM